MNFTREDRKTVYDFFENILLKHYTEPVYYEYVRGHISKAPEVVKQYVLKKCKGDNLLDYFRRRKNYFEIEGTRISLRKEPKTNCPGKFSYGKNKTQKTKIKRQRSEDSWSNASNVSNDKQVTNDSRLNSTGKLEHEDFVHRYFTLLLENKKSIKIESIDFEKLPKKVIRHLTLYCEKSIMNYLSNLPDTFQIDDDKNVCLSNEARNCKNSSTGDDTNFVPEKNDFVINPEIQKAYIWLESIEFFTDILKKKNTKSLHIDKLASYLTQAVKSVKVYLKTFKPFKTFFSNASLIFHLNENEVELSSQYKNVLQQARSRIQCAFNEPGSEVLLASDFQDIVNSQYSPENSTDFDVWDEEYEISDEESEIDSEESEISDEEDEHINKRIEKKNEDTLINGTIFNQNYEDDEKDRWDVVSPIPKSESPLPICTKEPDVNPKTNDSDEGDANFLRFLFIIEMFCVEMIEMEINYSFQYTKEAVEFFVGVLKDSSQRWTLTSLNGTIGQASTDIISFVNKKYKKEKFYLFFEEHEEFTLKSSLVSLSPTYKEIFQSRLDAFSKYEKEFCFQKFYESDRYRTVLIETFALFFEVHEHLKNNNKIKLNRLCNVIERFPHCLEWIKSLNGQTLQEKTKTFLEMVDVFDFQDEGYISISSQTYSNYLKIWLQQMSEAFKNSKLDMPVFNLVKNTNDTELKIIYNSEKDCFWSLVEFFEGIKNFTDDINHSHYYKVVDMLPNELLLKIAKTNQDSRIIINALLANKLFWVKNGRIVLNNSKHPVNSDMVAISPNPGNSVEESKIIATDIHVPGSSESFTWNPICHPVDTKETTNETDTSSKHNCNAASENQNLLESNVNGKEILQNENLINNTVCFNDNIEFANGFTGDELQGIQNLSRDIEEQIHNGMSDPDYQRQSLNKKFENVSSDHNSDKTSTNLYQDDFDSEVSDNQSLEDPVDLDQSTGSSISDVDNDSCFENSDLTLLPIKKDKYQSTESSPLNYQLNDFFYYQSTSPEADIQSQNDSRTSEDNAKSQSVICNVSDSNATALIKEHQTDLDHHRENPIKECSNSNNFELSKNFPVDQYKESKFNCEKGDILTRSEIKCSENKVLVQDQGEKHLSDVEIKILDTDHDSISEMGLKANCLAKEVFIKRGTFDKVYVATTSLIFYVERNEPFIENKKYHEVVTNLSNFEKSSTAIKKSVHISKSPSLSSLESCTNEFDSLEKSKGKSDESFEYPLQPITAQIILLTADSCIAQTDIASRKQNIYFLKCVYSCEDENCCSNCFNDLHIGDSVSCFVPIPEMSRKMWIPIMVSKEETNNCNEIDGINQMLQNQSKNGSYRQCEVDIQLPLKKYDLESISVQTEYLCADEECQTEILVEEMCCQTEILIEEKCSQTEFLVEEICCQTDISGEVKRKFTTADTMCQTASTLVQDVSSQIEWATNSIDCQTDITGINALSTECQTDLTGSVKECVDSENSLCQTNLSGSVKKLVNTVDCDSQTISTGSIMVMQYYHH